MSVETTEEPTRTAGGPRLPAWAAPVAVGTVLTVLALQMWRQVVHPFLRHDDWEFVLPVDAGRIAQHERRLEAEGRWFNYAWWRAIGHLLNPTVVTVLFALGVLVLAAALAWRWSAGWLAVPVMVALAASPMIGELGFWPATLTPTMLLLATAALLLPRCREHPRRLLGWIVVSTVLVFLSYPAYTLILLVVLVVELVDRTVREMVLPVVTFCLSYALGTAVAFTANLIAFDRFGLEVLPWRNPNPVHGFGDLAENLGRAFDVLHSLANAMTVPAGIGVIALVGCFLVPDLRARAVNLSLLIVLGLGIQSSSVVMLGVTTPFRSTAWLWLVAIVPLVWLFRVAGAPRWQQVAALLAVVVVGAWGVRYDLRELDGFQHDRVRFERTLDRLATLVEERPDAKILVVGTEADWERADFLQEYQYLQNKAYDDLGVRIYACRPPGCALLQRPSVLERADEGRRAFLAGEDVVVVPSAHRR